MSVDFPVPIPETNREIAVHIATSNGVHVRVRKRA